MGQIMSVAMGIELHPINGLFVIMSWKLLIHTLKE
jgi:hypothetical protein